MPLFAGDIGAPPTTDPELVVAWREDVGTIHATWTDPTGVEWPLSDIAPERGHFTRAGIAGWGAPEFEIIADPMPRGGEVPRFVRQQPARITWPLYIWGETHQQFVDRYRALRRAFLMTVHKGLPGVLRVTRPDGSAREIQAFYEGGWAGNAGENWLFANPVVTLYCPDGAWTDPAHIVVRRSASSSVPFNNPFLTLSSAQVLGQTTVDNPGDLTAWPTWTITGPCTAITATNNSVDHSFALTHDLAAGEEITIVTAGPHPNVRGPLGENLSGALNWPAAYLWGLDPGTNDVEFSVAGSTAATQIELVFHARYEGA